MIAPRISKISGALLDKNDDCAPWIKIEAGTCVQVPTPVSLLYFSAVIRNEPRITFNLLFIQPKMDFQAVKIGTLKPKYHPRRQQSHPGGIQLTLNFVGQAYYCPESAFRNPSGIIIEESMKTF